MLCLALWNPIFLSGSGSVHQIQLIKPASYVCKIAKKTCITPCITPQNSHYHIHVFDDATNMAESRFYHLKPHVSVADSQFSIYPVKPKNIWAGLFLVKCCKQVKKLTPTTVGFLIFWCEIAIIVCTRFWMVCPVKPRVWSLTATYPIYICSELSHINPYNPM